MIEQQEHSPVGAVGITDLMKPADCEHLICQAEESGFSAGMVGGDVYNTTVEIRQTSVCFLEDLEKWQSIYRVIEEVARGASEWYGFEIRGVQAAQVSRYETGQFYNWHMDLGTEGTSGRKLSLSVELSDSASYEGGIMEFDNDYKPHDRQRGSAVVFPSYLRHRVTPVTRGVRYSLVAWIVGPGFK